MDNNYDKTTSIRLDPEIKDWLYIRRQNENRSLGNLINTILKDEKDRNEFTKNIADRLEELQKDIDKLNEQIKSQTEWIEQHVK